MKVTRLDTIKEQKHSEAMQHQRDRVQETMGIVKINGQYLREINLRVSAKDLAGFRKYKSELQSYERRQPKAMEIVHEMFSNRNELDELIVTESESLSPMHIRIGTDLYEDMKQDAKRQKVNLNDYMRAILYTHGKEAGSRRHERIMKSKDAVHYKRILHLPLWIQPETRERIYDKHGHMTNSQLMGWVQELIEKQLD